jgi:flagellar motor switch protein FliG
MNTLNELKTMTDVEIQNWLRENTDVSTLVQALLESDDEVKNCIFRNMSKHAAILLQDELKKYKN